MTDKSIQPLRKPRPPVGFPAAAPPDFASPEQLTHLQLAAKKMIRWLLRRGS
jgi:hypothetical protein